MNAVRMSLALAVTLSGLLSTAAFSSTPTAKASAEPGGAALAPVATQLSAKLGVPITTTDLAVWGSCDMRPGAGEQLLVSCQRGPDDGVLALVTGQGDKAEVTTTLDLHARVKEIYVVSLDGVHHDHLLVRTAASGSSGGTIGRQMVIEGGAYGMRSIWEREERDEIEGNADLSRPRGADLWCLVVDEGGRGVPDHVTAYNMKFHAPAGVGPEGAALVSQTEQALTYDIAARRIIEGAASLADTASRLKSLGEAAAAAATAR